MPFSRTYTIHDDDTLIARDLNRYDAEDELLRLGIMGWEDLRQMLEASDTPISRYGITIKSQ